MRIKILCLAEANEQPLAYRFRLQFAQGIEVSHKAAVPAPPFPLLFPLPLQRLWSSSICIKANENAANAKADQDEDEGEDADGLQCNWPK